MARYNESQVQMPSVGSVGAVQTQSTKDVDLLSKDIENLIGGAQKAVGAVYEASEYATTLAALDTDYNTKKGYEEIYNQTVGAKLAKGEQPTSTDYKNMIDWRNNYFRDVTQQVVSDDENNNNIYREKFYKPSKDALDKANQSDMKTYQGLFRVEKKEEYGQKIADAPADMSIENINTDAEYLKSLGVQEADEFLWNKKATSAINRFTDLDTEYVEKMLLEGRKDELLDKYFGTYLFLEENGKLSNFDGVEDKAALAMKRAFNAGVNVTVGKAKQKSSKLLDSVNSTGSILTGEQDRDLTIASQETQKAINAGIVSNEAVTLSAIAALEAKKAITGEANKLFGIIRSTDYKNNLEVDKLTKSFLDMKVPYKFTDDLGVVQTKYITPTKEDFDAFVQDAISTKYEPLLTSPKILNSPEGVRALDELYNITQTTGVKSELFADLKDFGVNGIATNDGAKALDTFKLFEAYQAKNEYKDMEINFVSELRDAINNEAKKYDLTNPEENALAGRNISFITDMYTNLAKSSKQKTTIDNTKAFNEVFKELDSDDLANGVKGLGALTTSFGSEYLAGGLVDYFASTSSKRLSAQDEGSVMETLQQQTVFISESVFGDDNTIQSPAKEFIGIGFSKSAIGNIPTPLTVKKVVKDSARNLFGIEDLDTTDSDVSFFQAPDDNGQLLTRVVIESDGIINTFVLTEKNLINGIALKSTTKKESMNKAIEKARKTAVEQQMKDRYQINSADGLDTFNLP